MFFVEKMARETVKINGEWYVVDTSKTPDTRKWETARAKVDLNEFSKILWEGENDYTDNDIIEWCEELPLWFTVVEVYKNKKQAEKGHEKWCGR